MTGIGRDEVAEIALRTVTPFFERMAEAQRQQGELLCQHSAILQQLVGRLDERRLGDSIEIRHRIRLMWPESREPQRKSISDHTTARIRELGGVVRTQYGRILIDRDHLHILDGMIDMVRSRATERNRMPLYEQSNN